MTAESVVRYCQVICIAMLVGLLTGGGVLGFMGLTRAGALTASPPPNVQPSPPAAATPTDIFPWTLLVIAVAGVVVAVLAGVLLLRQARAQWAARADDEAAMARVYRGFTTRCMVRAAALEAPGLMGAALTLLSGNWLMLLATLGSVIALTVLFPTPGRMDRWVEDVTGG